ncbi:MULTISPECIES: hypothetical protein [Janthinobacterium]|uniref:hypothetical protein n=1 Tax=Janthinobacterium TaxID=29580 RepID=UPI00158806CE|nr:MULTISPECIES: hypothetical protein [Janthinobacterium]MBW3501504.1 hypothetical protein [Janthinobacterium sp. NKUCC08_JDC]MDX8123885.1 hypothetical protein [Janthinobacterium sp. GMG2]
MFDLPAGQPVASRIGTRFPPPAPFALCGCALQLQVAVCAANPFKAGLAGLFFACFWLLFLPLRHSPPPVRHSPKRCFRAPEIRVSLRSTNFKG